MLQEALEQCALADRLGIDYVWEVEHHFLEEYSHSSAPEVFLAAVSQRTKRIRLGHGIVQMPPPFNHPARVAERIATLDLVSDGRVDFGTGESSSEAELGGFRIDPADKRAMWEEGLRVALRCLTEEPFTGHAGRYVTMPPRNVVPKPPPAAASARVGGVQPARDHPPRGPEGHRRAVVLVLRPGGGAPLGGRLLRDAGARGRADRRRRQRQHRLRHTVHVPPRRGDGHRARRRGHQLPRLLARALLHLRPAPPGADRPVGRVPGSVARRPATIRRPSRRPPRSGDRLGAKVVLDDSSGLRGAVGTPAQIREYLRRYEEYGVDQVIFASQAGRNRHEHVMESLELFGARGAARVPGARGAACAREGRATRPGARAVLARKPASDHPPLADPDYEIPAIPRSTADREGSEKFHRYLDDLAEKMAAGEDVRRRLA